MEMSGVGNFIAQMENIFIETECVSSTNSDEKDKEEEVEEKEMKENL